MGIYNDLEINNNCYLVSEVVYKKLKNLIILIIKGGSYMVIWLMWFLYGEIVKLLNGGLKKWKKVN